MKQLNELYIGLVKASIKKLLGVSDNHQDITESDLYKLLSFASILSLSEKDNEKAKAYEIVSRIFEVVSEKDYKIIGSADLILSRIGNFPGRMLMRDRFNKGAEPTLSLFFSLERIARETENSLEGKQLTDFQYDLFSSLKNYSSLSVSAPTSAGKSFVLTLNAIRCIKNHSKECIVYIVPTRALISEVSNKIRSECVNSGLTKTIIRTSPTLVDRSKIVEGIVYVLTQERFISLLTESVNVSEFVINLLLVDEAHEIQKGKRGIILQNAVEVALDLYPNANIMFSSPLIKNPEYFLNVFRREYRSKSFIETISPVAQNILLVNQVDRKVKTICVSALLDDKDVVIGEFDIDFSFRGGKVDQKAAFAHFVSDSGGAVIVFENDPSIAEDVAISLSQIITSDDLPHDYLEFIAFVKEEMHVDYSLAYCMEFRVAFHYGNMPSIIRNGIEFFFKRGDIKYIICTSTLLQGVNLPAKHIILDNPYSGSGPMTRADFLNLSGRAGRLLQEFHGNVWCLRPNDWDEKVYTGDKLQVIHTAMSNVMLDGGEIICNTIDGLITDPLEKELADIAFAKLFHELKRDELQSEYFLRSDKTDDYYEVLDYNFSKISRMGITVPDELLRLNMGIRPDYIQRLYDYFILLEQLDDYILYSPFKKGGKKRIDIAISIIRDCFSWGISHHQALWISMLAHQWMTGKSLSTLISYEVERGFSLEEKLKSDEDVYFKRKKTSSIIRGVLKGLETHVRYNLVRYIKVYQDVLRFVLVLRGENTKASFVENISVYLEFGSCNSIDLNLMSVGLSRSTALLIRKKIKFPQEGTPEDYINLLKGTRLEKITIPSYCVREIQQILGVVPN
ncbi:MULTISPECIES: DEAD/DEAH box helicase [Phytobacter]|uniref:DEAD/DEAH box helicase n=1 Tax=Phytobacter diazotrophicus TaxID=395631 RepID=A0ABN6LX15_9ENTR|nr:MULTISPECIES: DEAD/DEAH box helicase [Phytobacter]MDU4151540.1 DEAD/DEAH box helicase [Enterobacteriaceae bacterium]BBE79470.1 DEAD/DEAH box helicase [Phytobacter sp. MRY16-398]BDD52851.1 DEAD/DEAH box helicase [Phytobacter diazotrophicus]BEG83779.1 DEAD/DEAH box helicase [Phytobacter diazotrophicus]BEG89677.1 DEAD/DEAH box helicase [Phytobacter diazotrophicus]